MTEDAPRPISPVEEPRGRIIATTVRTKNRRKRYLDQNPNYFDSSLELADPLLYDRLVRRFQTAAEREEEGKRKGFSGVLHTDILRSEARLEALSRPDPHSLFSYSRGPNGEILEEDQDDVPQNKDEGWSRWKYEMEMRFLRGDDDDFEYETVDDNQAYDDREEEDRQELEKYLDDEEPNWVTDGKTPQGETGVQDF
jgi:Coiled-coil domain containing protein (DUF2052)